MFANRPLAFTVTSFAPLQVIGDGEWNALVVFFLVFTQVTSSWTDPQPLPESSPTQGSCMSVQCNHWLWKTTRNQRNSLPRRDFKSFISRSFLREIWEEQPSNLHRSYSPRPSLGKFNRRVKPRVILNAELSCVKISLLSISKKGWWRSFGSLPCSISHSSVFSEYTSYVVHRRPK